MTRIHTVILDLAGTTVVDVGLVEAAFTRAWDHRQGRSGRNAAIQWVRETMGRSKIEVFRALVPEEEAQALNTAFERSFDELVAEGRVAAIPGAEAAIQQLREQDRKIAFTTGFARPTAEAILDRLGWLTLADTLVTPAEAGRGRFAPDVNLAAALRTQAPSVASLAVCGDTESDAGSGVAAGAGLVVGVRTGGREEAALTAAGADEVIDSVADLPALLERRAR